MAEYNQNNNSMQVQSSLDDEQVLRLSDILGLIWNHKGWYIFSLLVCLAAAAFYLYKTPKVYSRNEKLIIDETTQNTMVRNLTSFSGGYSRYYSGSSIDNELAAFVSPDLMEKVVERLGLETKYVDQQFLREREMYRNSPVEMQVTGDRPVFPFSFTLVKTGKESYELKDFKMAGEFAEGRFKGNLKDTLDTPAGKLVFVPTKQIDTWKNDIAISWLPARSRGKAYCGRLSAGLSNKQSSVVVLTIQDVYPSRAEVVLSTLLDIYNEDWVEMKNTSARKTSIFINDRLSYIERELGGIESNIKDYKQSHQITDVASDASTMLQQSTNYAQQAFEIEKKMEVARYIKQWINDPAHADDLIPANMAVEGGNVGSQIAEYNAALLERNRLLPMSSESNPMIKSINNNLDAIKVAINRSVDNLIATLDIQRQKIVGQENRVLSKLSSTSGQQLELASMDRQQKVKEQLYIFLLQKREENELQSLLTVENTRLIQKPSGSGAPISPNRMMIILIAALLGLGIPFAYFYLRNVLDNTVKGRSDVSRLSVPFLAEIPQLGKKHKLPFRENRFDESNTRILVESGKRDMVNEAFRVLRTNLDLMIHTSKETSKVIMVTSFNPNAGKTFTILNLSASMALKGAKVIIVDTDLRKATLSKALDKNTTGVAAFLSGKSGHIREHVTSISENLDLLSVGSIPPNPAELLVSDRFGEMIEHLKEDYDYIFLDCPPVDVVADTSIIAPKADITIFIIRAGLFDKRALAYVEQLYADKKYNRMALIVNGVETYKGKSGYGYGYGYGYGNESNGKEGRKEKAKA